jgi:hypothetical protein
LRRAGNALESLGIAVVVVTFQPPAVARAYAAETGLAWPLLVDEDRTLYAAYGMGRGRGRDIWGLASMAAYGRLLLRGQLPRAAAGDVYQLGGDVLVDPAGLVRIQHVGTGPADRPAVDAILDAVRGAPPAPAAGSGDRAPRRQG